MITVEYYLYGYKYTLDLTVEQARQELHEYGWPNAKRLTEREVRKFIHKIY